MLDKSKVTLLVTGLGAGGAEMIVLEQAKYLQQRGYDVQVIALTQAAALLPKFTVANISVISLTFSITRPQQLWRLYMLLRQRKPAVLHTHLFHANFIGRLLGALVGVPCTISTIHNINFGGKLRQRLLRWTDRLANRTIVISELVAREMREKSIVSEERLVCIPNGIATDYFVPLSDTKQQIALRKKLQMSIEAKVFVSIGQLREQKAYHILIKAVASQAEVLRQQQANFYILGEGELYDELRTQIKEHNLTDLIHLVGLSDQVREYLQAADYFVMSSLWEGLPLSLLEAMSCGVIPIVTNVGGISEVVTDTTFGTLVPPNDIQELATALVRASEDDVEIDALQRAQIRQRVIDSFSQTTMLKRYEDLYVGK